MMTIRALLIAILSIGVAHADPTDADKLVRAHYEVAQQYYKNARYPEAVAAFELAYREKPLPLLLYNIAQAARLGGDSDKALEMYRRYLEAQPNAPERPSVEQHVHELEPIVAARQVERAKAEAQHATIPTPVAVVAPPPPPQHSNRRLAIALGVTGAVLVAAGLTLGLTLGLSRGAPSSTYGNFVPQK